MVAAAGSVVIQEERTGWAEGREPHGEAIERGQGLRWAFKQQEGKGTDRQKAEQRNQEARGGGGQDGSCWQAEVSGKRAGPGVGTAEATLPARLSAECTHWGRGGWQVAVL